MTLAGLILAGGASSRMGSPKALLRYRGETFLSRLERLLRPFCDPLIVVVGHELSLPVTAALRVINPHPERGMLSSLQCGLRALASPPDGVLFTPVDYPAVREDTVSALASAFAANPNAAAVLPRHNGKRGHPLVVSRALVDEFLALPPTAEASQVIRSHGDDIVYVEVDDPGIHADIDTPADYAALQAGPGGDAG